MLYEAALHRDSQLKKPMVLPMVPDAWLAALLALLATEPAVLWTLLSPSLAALCALLAVSLAVCVACSVAVAYLLAPRTRFWGRRKAALPSERDMVTKECV